MNVPESDELPPPPYSETDIYSSAGSGGRSSCGRTPATSQAAPSLAGESTASRSRPPTSIGPSQNDVVYTPPLTPNVANYQYGIAPPSSSAAAAEAYFESRPLENNDSPPHFHINHTITISPASRPDDFPFPQGWDQRQVTHTDWQTFLNFLLPAHIAASNQEVLDRKLRAEEESLSPSTTAGPSSSSGRSHASAQLGLLRISHGETVAHSAEARREAGLVVSEWNVGFFQPRYLEIHLAFETPVQENQRPAMPGAWNSGSDQNTPQLRHQGPYQPPPHPPPPLIGPPQLPPWAGSGYQQQPRSGFSFAGIRMNDDGLYIGNSLSADRNGIRLGGLVADTNGLRYRDNVVVGPGMFSGGPNPEYPGAQHHPIQHPQPVSMGPQPTPGSGGIPPAQNYFRDPPLARPNLNRAPSGSPLYPQQQGPPRRSQSASSISSKSSTTSSTSSLDSLPDYDELDGAQIPLYRSTLQSWLVTPEKQVTKQDVQRLRAELREARRREAEYPPGNVDKQALKAEIKSLKQEWRALRRTQRSVRREARRQRRAQRRQEKRDRRDSRQAQKQAERPQQQRRNHGSWSGPPSGPPPGMGMGMPGPRNIPPPGPPPFRGPGPQGVPSSGAPPHAPFGFAPGFGRGFGMGPGRGHGPPFLPHPPMPGSWRPDEPQRVAENHPPGAQGNQQRMPPPELEARPMGPAREAHEASQAKFKKLDEMEKELARKMDRIFETARDDKDKGPEGEEGKTSCEGSGASREVLEKEVDELMKRVEQLRMEADETFARELVEEERRQAMPR